MKPPTPFFQIGSVQFVGGCKYKSADRQAIGYERHS
jgi:hypothetical protein